MLTKQDLTAVGNLIESKLDKKLLPIKKDLKHVKKVLDKTAYTLDKDNIATLARVKRIERHLDLPQMEFA